MANGTVATLTKLKEDIERAKQNKAQLEGKLEAYYGQLSAQGADTLEDARALLNTYDKSIAAQQKKFNTLYKEIENELSSIEE